MMRHVPPAATPVDWTAQRAAFSGQPADVTRFRSALEGYLGAPACFLASSGRTALFMLLSTLRAGTPDAACREVVLPAYTCPSLAKVIIDSHLQPRFVDVGPYTMSYNVTELATAVSPRTLAVILVHPFGIPHALDAVAQLAHAARRARDRGRRAVDGRKGGWTLRRYIGGFRSVQPRPWQAAVHRGRWVRVHVEQCGRGASTACVGQSAGVLAGQLEDGGHATGHDGRGVSSARMVACNPPGRATRWRK